MVMSNPTVLFDENLTIFYHVTAISVISVHVMIANLKLAGKEKTVSPQNRSFTTFDMIFFD